MFSYLDKGFGTPIVFIHGLCQMKYSWNPQHELSNKYRLIVPDLIGHGDSEINDEITIYNFASNIIKLLERLDIQSTYICGLSLGGIVAQEIYRQRPDLVKGLILANTCSYIPMFAYGIVNGSKQYIDNGTLIDCIANRGLHNKAYINEAKKSFYITDRYIEAAKSAMGLNYFYELSRIKCPVLLIGGYFDKVTPFINVHMMKMFIRNAKSVILSSGHLSNIEKREEFNEAIDRFVAGSVVK
ncbi:alpha/beta fold hydrolase [Cytobacillus sp. Hz8]|uniref:alpha/beta fold hydrolase n=1 Tax=Cytobacillus sp. Hz8 TaxID=3347168 RepID=UPI0035DCD926